MHLIQDCKTCNVPVIFHLEEVLEEATEVVAARPRESVLACLNNALLLHKAFCPLDLIFSNWGGQLGLTVGL